MHWSKMLRGALASVLMLGFSGVAERAAAQTTPAPSVSTPSPAPETKAPAPAGTPSAPAPDAAAPGDKGAPDTSISQVTQLQPRPVIQFGGQSSWDDGFKALNDSFTRLNEALGKANLHAAGNPIAVFTETDDNGFKFNAMVPVDKAPDAKPADMPADLGFAMSPGGKVMKFQHRSAYDDIDATYEAITAYLDEKGIDAQNMFAEEYLNRTKTPDDPSLEVDIYVFLK